MSILCVALFINLGAAIWRKKAEVSGAVMHMLLLFACLDLIYYFSLIDLLKPGMWASLAVVAAGSVVLLAKDRGSGILTRLKEYLDTGTVLNMFTSLLMFCIYFIRKPILYYWDETRLWGPMAAVTKAFDRLYTIGISITDSRAYPPGSALLNYFYTFFDRDYTDWGQLASYALLFIAVFSRTASVVEEKTGKKALASGVFLFLFLSPFTTLYHTITKSYSSISYAYATSMVDLNLAIVFLAVIAVYIYRPQKKYYILPLIHLITIKKNGIFFALLAVCVIMAFELFRGKLQKENLRRAVIALAVMAVSVLATYGGWRLHHEAYKEDTIDSGFSLKYEGPYEVQEQESGGSVSHGETSPLAMLIPSLRTERYKEIITEMKGYVMTNRETIYARDIYLIIVLLAAGMCTALIAPKGYGVPVGLVSVGLTAGCYVYLIGVAYQMQFYHDMMVEYPRYMLSYYYGWIYVIVLLVCVFADRISLLTEILILALNLLSFRFIYLTKGLDRTFLDAPDNVYTYQEDINVRLEPVKSMLKKGDRVLIVFPDADGGMYNTVKFRLMPAICGVDTLNTGIDFSTGFRREYDPDSGKTWYNFADPDTFMIILDRYFDYVMICEPDREFVRDYGELFENGVKSWTLYEVNGAGPVREVAP